MNSPTGPETNVQGGALALKCLTRDVGDAKNRFFFYLVPNFTMLALTSALEVLHLANEVLGAKVYEWRLVSSTGETVKSSCGIPFQADHSISAARAYTGRAEGVRMAIVCSGKNVQQHPHDLVQMWLRECRLRRIGLGALGTGAYILAKAGLLKDRRCAIHWQDYPGFEENFIDVQPTPNIYEIDDGIYTSAGGTTAFEMMLHIVSDDVGFGVGTEICQRAIVSVLRDRSERQRIPFAAPMQIDNKAVKRLVEVMEQNLAEALPLHVVAKRAGISRRHMERHFRDYFNCSPAKYYMRLRLERSKSLLQQTEMSVVDIAIACGFTSSSHFSRTFRQSEGISPHESRRPKKPNWQKATHNVSSFPHRQESLGISPSEAPKNSRSRGSSR